MNECRQCIRFAFTSPEVCCWCGVHSPRLALRATLAKQVFQWTPTRQPTADLSSPRAVGLEPKSADLLALVSPRRLTVCLPKPRVGYWCRSDFTHRPLPPPFRYGRSREGTCTSHQHGWELARELNPLSLARRDSCRHPIPMRDGSGSPPPGRFVPNHTGLAYFATNNYRPPKPTRFYFALDSLHSFPTYALGLCFAQSCSSSVKSGTHAISMKTRAIIVPITTFSSNVSSLIFQSP